MSRLFRPPRQRFAVLPAIALVLTALGCQHTPPPAPDLAAHAAAWPNRDIALPRVADLAAALGAQDDHPPHDFDPADGLHLVEAEAVVLWFNPALRVARLEAGIPEAAARHAGAWPDPTLDLEGGRKREDQPGWFRHVPDRVARDWISGASLSLTLPVSGRPAVARAAAHATHRAALFAVAEAEWQTLNDFHDTWLAWAAARKAEALDAEHAAVFAEFADSAARLAAAGELPPAIARQFALEQGRAEARHARATHEADRLRIAVHTAMGLAPEAPVVLLPSLALHPGDIPPAERRARVLETHPRLQRLHADHAAAVQRLRLARRARVPDLVLSPGFNREGGESALVVGLGYPIPLWNANRREIAEATAERAAAAGRLEAAAEEVLGALAQAEARLAGATAQRHKLETDVIPLADAQIDEAQRLLRLGEIDLDLLHGALVQTFEIRMELLDAALQEQRARAEIQAFLLPHTLSTPAPETPGHE